MPRTTSKYNHVKVYRPTGTRYGEGRHVVLNNAIALAIGAFAIEFGYVPKQDVVVIDIVGSVAEWHVHSGSRRSL